VLEELRVDAAHALFVDDNAINVLAARSVGMHARHVPRFEALAPVFAEFRIGAAWEPSG